MATPAAKIDSNITGLRYALENPDGTLPVTPTWLPLEPNSYDKFGGSLKTLARNPINDSRQRKKGVVVDLDANAGFEIDITEENTQQLMQSFLFAAMRTKAELLAPAVTAAGDDYQPAAGGAAYVAGNLLFAKNYTKPENNGLKKCIAGSTATSVKTASSLADEAGATTGTISKVGHEFAAGAVTVDVSGALPKLVFTAFDPTTLGLIPGEWINVGDDAAGMQFASAANNGLKRVKSIDATSITIDKSSVAMVTDAGTGKTLRIFFGRVLKNESGTLIKRQTVQFERTLGAPDLDAPTVLQAEYVTKCIADTFDLTIKTADKLTAKLGFMGSDQETQVGLKTGNRPQIVEADAFNATSHVARLSLNAIDPLSATPTDLFAFLLDMTLSIKNNIKANKAIKFLGAFDHSAGTFEVDAKMTAYFSTVEAIQTVRDNADVTLDVTFAQAHRGITIDLPLVTLATDGADVKQDEAIQLSLDSSAATGAKVDPNMNHTMLVVYWDYLPNLAA
jgi:hypothetical protein